MKKIVCLLLTMLLAFSLASCSFLFPDGPGTDGPGTDSDDKKEISGSENIINVYLIAGQSNAVGYGMDTGKVIANSDPRYTDGFENVLYYGSQERWNGSYPNQVFKPVTLGMGVAQDRSGAEIGIAAALADNGEMNAIIKCAQGATHIYPDSQYEVSLNYGTWTSPSYIENNNIDLSENELIGHMYRRFEETVKTGLKLLIEDGYTPVIKGVWWMQGEAEMFTYEMASEYKELYETLIVDTRNMLSEASGYDCSDVPFICGLPKWNTKNSPAPAFQTHVRNSMIAVANSMDNVSYVDCMPLNQHDDWHFDAAGQKYLGESFIERLKDFEDDEIFDGKISIDSEIRLLMSERGLEFKAGLTNYNSKNNYKYGFIIVPTAELAKNNIREQYIEKMDDLNIEYQNIPSSVKLEKIDEQYSDIYFSANISGIAEEDLNTSYSAIAYIENEYGNRLYSAVRSDSVVRLASQLLYTSDEGREGIQAILNDGGAADLEIVCDDQVVIKYSEALSTHQLTVTNSIGTDLFIKYSSDDPTVVSVDQNGMLTAHQLGTATILVECAGKSKSVSVSVESVSSGGVSLDGVISDGEYAGEVIKADNGNLFADITGMTKDGNLYLAFVLTHGDWSPHNDNWWLNDNIEFKLNNGASHTVIFYDGVATYSENITYGMSNTIEVDGKLVTTVELCIEDSDAVYQLKIGMNGTNFGWLGAIWNDHCNLAYITEDGIALDKPVNLGGGLVLDGIFDEDVYTDSVKNNSIKAEANGANVEMIGTLVDNGVLLGITVNHSLDPDKSTGGTGDWYTFMNVEFHFDGSDAQFISTVQNTASLGQTFEYCSSVKTDSGYESTFEIFIPYEAIGAYQGIASIGFTASGWFETGWCWMLNDSWAASHSVSADGLAKITE